MQTSPIALQTRLTSESQQKGNFQNGQILLGKVTKLFPNQTAEVQIGSQKVVATLEVPLKAGERYWLQVQPGEGTIHFKLLNIAESTTVSKNAADQLLTHLAISQDKESVALAEFMLKNQLPIMKESFDSALVLLKSADDFKQGLEMIKTMSIQNLPFVKDVFEALLSTKNGKSFHSMLSSLLQSFPESGETTVAVQQIKALLQPLVLPKQELFAEKGVQKMVSLWLQSDAPVNVKQGAYELLQKVGALASDNSETEFMAKLLNRTEEISGKSNGAQLLKEGLLIISSLHSIRSDNPMEVEKMIQGLNKLVKVEGGNTAPVFRASDEKSSLIKKLLQVVNGNQERALSIEKKSTQESNPILKLLNPSEELTRVATGKMSDLLMQGFTKADSLSKLSESQLQALNLVLESDFKTIDLSKGLVVAPYLKELSTLLGLSFEHALGGKGGSVEMLEQELGTLKPLLMKLLQEEQPVLVKEMAEQVVHRITAQQLMAQENGPLQQLLVQIPLHLDNHQTDLTLKWSGRRTKDGGIDPDYCRILFYLDLETLNETIIDMVIQNRIMKVSVINDNVETLEALSRPLINILKQNLESMDYKLSGVGFKNTTTRNSIETKNVVASKVNGSYSGLDLRI